jgi:hypothetical protein
MLQKLVPVVELLSNFFGDGLGRFVPTVELLNNYQPGVQFLAF